MATTAAILIHAKLKDTPTWRQLLVPVAIRYDQLHVLLQLAFGWQNAYLHVFYPLARDNKQYVPASYDEMGVTDGVIASYPTEKNYLYPDISEGPVVYDYAIDAGYSIELTLKEEVSFAELKDRTLPSCTAGRGPNPPNELTNTVDDTVFHRADLNRALAIWAQAGNQMILADDDGLTETDLDDDY